MTSLLFLFEGDLRHSNKIGFTRLLMSVLTHSKVAIEEKQSLDAELVQTLFGITFDVFVTWFTSAILKIPSEAPAADFLLMHEFLTTVVASVWTNVPTDADVVSRTAYVFVQHTIRYINACLRSNDGDADRWALYQNAVVILTRWCSANSPAVIIGGSERVLETLSRLSACSLRWEPTSVAGEYQKSSRSVGTTSLTNRVT